MHFWSMWCCSISARSLRSGKPQACTVQCCFFQLKLISKIWERQILVGLVEQYMLIERPRYCTLEDRCSLRLVRSIEKGIYIPCISLCAYFEMTWSWPVRRNFALNRKAVWNSMDTLFLFLIVAISSKVKPTMGFGTKFLWDNYSLNVWMW